jgi:hypothetical protein
MSRERTGKTRPGIQLLLLVAVASFFTPGCGRYYCKEVDAKVATAPKQSVPGLRALPAVPTATRSKVVTPKIATAARENTGVIGGDTDAGRTRTIAD